MEEKQHIGSLFNRIAAGYDRFNHLTSLGIDHWWRHQAISRMKPADKVLDVAVGTGDLAIALVKSGKVGHVTGIDLSTGMMAVGAEKVRKLGLEQQITFVEGSALALPYEDNSFDAVTCAYGVRNFSNTDQGLKEFQRVLKPGGQLIILEFSYPGNSLIAALYNFYFKHIMTRIGTWMTHDRKAFAYFYASVKGFIWGEEMLRHLSAAGFSDCHFQSQTFGISTLYTACKHS
ncbi:MAG: bifunctional demethylmenaquinone methyltransferase/2-methoxy-6-polyprenyl-1,4-benzoquinol methylase UbiE [Paludibacteraceae bacterium]|nr:bifunctional demethylmenaquinone methyltransferase/2-methoxy-6-polyprenyl-1,4-benzoquinol methylase UbiE [Paludibacteraceae bacterium]